MNGYLSAVIPSFPPALSVIPAKAGIHAPAHRHAQPLPGFWIPAGAGMTVWAAGMTDNAGGNDRVRREWQGVRLGMTVRGGNDRATGTAAPPNS